jgi:type II secretory pathway component PulK
VLALVLALLMIASLMIGAAMQRHGVQQRMVGRQINEYQRHHEMFGVRAIVSKWLRENRNAQLAAIAAETEAPFHYAVRLPRGAFIRVWVRDGQGLPLDSLADVPADMREAYGALLDRLPEDRDDLLRSVGPPQISINAAPRPVLEAFFEEDAERFAREVIDERDDERLDAGRFSEILDDLGVPSEDRTPIGPMVVYDSDLWQVVIDVTDEVGTRRFRMMMQREQGLINELEWVEMPPPTPPPTIEDLPASLRTYVVPPGADPLGRR